MYDPIDDKLLARYLSNECTAEEIKIVKKWIHAHADNKKYFELMKVTWEARETASEVSKVTNLWESVAQQAHRAAEGVDHRMVCLRLGDQVDVVKVVDSLIVLPGQLVVIQ